MARHSSTWFAAICLGAFIATAGAADIEPPRVQLVDKFGINMANGQVTHSLPTVSIGGALGLSHSVSVHANEFDYLGYRGFDDKFYSRARNAELCTTPGACSPRNVMRVHDFDDTVSFAYYVGGVLQETGSATSGYTYVPVGDERHTLEVSGNDLVWTKPDGTVVKFDRGTDPVKPASKDGILTSIVYPNGFTITVTLGGVSVNTNTGFQLKAFHEPDYRPMDKPNNWALVNAGPFLSSAESGWSAKNPKYIRGINAAVEYCAWTASTCTLSNAWPTATFEWPPGMPRTMHIGESTVQVIDAQGRTTAYRFRAYDLAYEPGSVANPGAVQGGETPNTEFAPRLRGVSPPGSAEQLVYDYKNVFANPDTDGWGTWDFRLQDAGVVISATRLGLNVIYDISRPFFSDTQNTASWPGNLSMVHLKKRSGDPAALYYADTLDGRVWYEDVGRNFVSQFDRNAAARENFTYQTRGNLTNISYTSGLRTVAAEYPPICLPTTRKTCNQPTRTRDSNGNWTDYTYHALSGQVETITYPANEHGVRPQTRFEYTPLSAHYYNANGSWITGSPIWMKTAEKSCINSHSTGSGCTGGDEVVTRYEYNHDNLLLTGVTVTHQAVTLRTCYQYDIYGNQIGKISPNANLFSCPTAHVERPYLNATRYNVGGQVTGTIGPDPDGFGPLMYPATRNTYGTFGATTGLLLKVESGELPVWLNESVDPATWWGFVPYLTRQFTYDSYGRKRTEAVIGADDVTESLTQYSYDDWGRVTCRAVRMNKAAYGSLPASACVQGAEGPAGPDRIFRYTYDEFDQVLTEERAVGTGVAQTYVTNTYAGRGKLTSQTDANGNRTELRYDQGGLWRLQRRVYPSPSSPGSVNESDYNQYGYDLNGNVMFERKRNGSWINNMWDNNNRLLWKDLSDNTYSQDVFYDYDLRGLQLHARFGGDFGPGVTNVFDAFGRLASSTTDMGGISRQLTYQYDRDGNRTRVTHPDGYFFEYGFDGLNRVNSLGESSAPVPFAGTTSLLTVTYRPSGHRLDIFRAGGATTNIDLDNVLRLESFTQDFAGTTDDLTNAFQYNPASQVVQLTRSNSQYMYGQVQSRVGSYVPNGLNQYTSIGGQTIIHDANGNLTYDGTLTYTYDMENRLVATAGVGSSLTYDPLGRLFQTTIAGTTTQFLYDGDALVGEYQGGALTRRYVHGDRVDEPWVQYNGESVGSSFRRYLHADHQGSIIAHSDSSGAVINKLAYDSYGIPATTNVDRFGFTGQAWLSQLGLFHYKARMYSPKLGRFLQTDPVGYKDDINLYTYVGNDPANATDPTGREILLQSHPVTGTGMNHSKITIIPKNQGKYRKDKRFANKLKDGRVFATLGAGPSSNNPLAPGRLVSDINRERDVNFTRDDDNSSSEELVLPAGMDEDAMIEQLFALDALYGDHLDYDFFPDRFSEGWNSNGYASGLAGAARFDGFHSPPRTPGFGHPVPIGEFSKPVVTVDCTPEYPDCRG